MRVIDPGHDYRLQILDAPKVEGRPPYEHGLVFVKREGEGYPGNVGSHSGTNIQEVLRAVVDRLEYVNKQIPDEDTMSAWRFVRAAIYSLEMRAARRHGRPATFTMDETIYGETCQKCGHVGCRGECHL